MGCTGFKFSQGEDESTLTKVPNSQSSAIFSYPQSAIRIIGLTGKAYQLFDYQSLERRNNGALAPLL